jgi:hypothetical protein
MEPLTSAAIAIATLIFTKAFEKPGEQLGVAVSTQAGKLLQLIRQTVTLLQLSRDLIAWSIA